MRVFRDLAVVMLATVGLSASPLKAADTGQFNTALNSILAIDFQSHVQVLADDSFEGREAGSRGGHAAAGYLREKLQQLGLTPAGEQGSYYQAFGDGYRNILAVVEGSHPELKNEYVVVSAHYDHVGYGTRRNSFGPIGYVHNGADDNASGVSGVLEFAEALTLLGPSPKRSLLIAFWDAEEKGLLGSKHWLSQPTVPLDQLTILVNADMIGNLRDRSAMVYGSRSAAGLRRLISENNTTTQLQLDFVWELSGNSDHYAFFRQDIPVLMFHTGLHDHYHRPNDDAHRINADGGQAVARLLFSTAISLANQIDRKPFRALAKQESKEDKQRLEQPLPPRPPRLGVTFEVASRRDDGEPNPVLIKQVLPGTPAMRAGLQPRDRLVRFAGQTVGSVDSLRLRILAASSPSTLLVDREGDEVELEVELDGSPLRLGVSWREDTAEPSTLIITQVVTGSPAHQGGIELGDRIYSIQDRQFADTQEFLGLFGSINGPVRLQIERSGCLQERTVHPLPSQTAPAS